MMRLLLMDFSGMLMDYPYEQVRLSATDKALRIKVLRSTECVEIPAERMKNTPEEELRKIAKIASHPGTCVQMYEIEMREESEKSVSVEDAELEKDTDAEMPDNGSESNGDEGFTEELPDMGTKPFTADFTAEWYNGKYTTKGLCTVDPVSREVTDIKAINNYYAEISGLSGGYFTYNGTKIPVYKREELPDNDKSSFRREEPQFPF